MTTPSLQCSLMTMANDADMQWRAAMPPTED